MCAVYANIITWYQTMFITLTCINICLFVVSCVFLCHCVSTHKLLFNNCNTFAILRIPLDISSEQPVYIVKVQTLYLLDHNSPLITLPDCKIQYITLHCLYYNFASYICA